MAYFWTIWITSAVKTWKSREDQRMQLKKILDGRKDHSFQLRVHNNVKAGYMDEIWTSVMELFSLQSKVYNILSITSQQLNHWSILCHMLLCCNIIVFHHNYWSFFMNKWCKFFNMYLFFNPCLHQNCE